MTHIVDAKDRFLQRKCPVGSVAKHPQYGLVEILTVESNIRSFLYHANELDGVREGIESADVGVLAEFDTSRGLVAQEGKNVVCYRLAVGQR